jgi:DNA-binding winged helix-turn-helix (wHTH) protein
MNSRTRHFYEFDSFRLDAAEQVLLRDGQPVPLSPKLFETLLALVQNSGHVIEKEELIRRVWPDTFVEENNLSQYISTLRKTLGDERHEQRYIETVPRRGYRFAAGVREVWDGNGQTLSAAHTKLSLSVKEEIEEESDSETKLDRGPDTTKRRAARVFGSMPVTIAALIIAAVAISLALFQSVDRDRPSIMSGQAVSFAASSSQANQEFTIRTFDPGTWPRTDAEIGVEGFVIEDFEDASLAPGLQMELSDCTDNFASTETLPMVFNPDVHDTGGARVFNVGLWDGSNLFINRRTPPPHGYADFQWCDVTFHIQEGATSFGFSLDDMDLNTELFVNGVSQANLRRLLPSGTLRNGYVRIDAAPGKTIRYVKVANKANDKTSDGIAFDHVAFKPAGF